MYSKSTKLLLLYIIFIFVSIKTFSLERYIDPDLLRTNSPPRYLEDGFLLTLPPNTHGRPYLRMNYDNWQGTYYFEKSFYGVPYIVIPYDLNSKKLIYKININGVWSLDPLNKSVDLDKYGTELSTLYAPNESRYLLTTPIIKTQQVNRHLKDVTFIYKNIEAKEVNLIIHKDRWNQFSRSMVLNRDGYWEITLPFNKGEYYYYFLVDGNKKIDINNSNRSYFEYLKELSVFSIE